MGEPKWVTELDVGSASETITNKWSGESIELEPLAVAVYDYIIGCDTMGKFIESEKAKNYFYKKWREAYYILLD